MKQEFHAKSNQSGFSTLEMLLAMAILVMMMTAVITVAFGSQSLISDSRASVAALAIAQQMLEKAQADSRKDFNLVVPYSATSTDGIYRQTLAVTTRPDFLTKEITATVKWTGEYNRQQFVDLYGLVTNFNNAVGGDTCDSIQAPDVAAWKNFKIQNSLRDMANIAGFSGETLSITDIDAYHGRLYATADTGNASTSSIPTFFIFDITQSGAITLVPNGFVDNDTKHKGGLAAVAVAGNYAFVANASGVAKGQLQVIDISAMPPVVAASYKVSSRGLGDSIFYKDGYVYLGLTAAAGDPEFVIVDVHNPLNPSAVSGSSYVIGHDVNAISVRDGYAYIATPDERNLVILDVSDPGRVAEIGNYNQSSVNHGKSVYLLGDTLYLGRTVGATEFTVLDVGNPASPLVLGSKSDINASIDGVVVRSGIDVPDSPGRPRRFAFGLAPRRFMALDVSDPAAIFSWAEMDLAESGNNTFEPVLDCEGNNFFIGSNNDDGRGFLSIVAP